MDDLNPGHKPPLYLYESDRTSGPTIEEVDSDTEPEYEKRRERYPPKKDRELAKFVVRNTLLNHISFFLLKS